MIPWATALGLVIGISVIASMYWQQTVHVGEVRILGTQLTAQQDVMDSIRIPEGTNPDSVDLDALVKDLKTLPYIRKVIPFVEPNGDLELQITERIPLALVLDGIKRAWVDNEGVVMPVSPAHPMDLPLVYGFSASPGDTLTRSDFIEIRDFLVAAREQTFGWVTISETVFDPKHGVVALSHEHGVKLLFGRGEFDVKLDNWKAFYTQVIREKGIQSMQQVDLRFTNQVVTKEVSL